MKKILFVTLLLFQFFLVFIEARAKEFKQLETPIMEKSVIVTEDGYYPQKIVTYSGVKVRLFLTSTTEMPSCFVVGEQNIFLPAKKGEVTEAEVYFDRVGEYNFYCPTGKIKGKFIVLEHPNDRRKRVRREVASKSKIKIWTPKDE